MKKLTLMSVLAVLCLNLHAQQPALKPLSIGDTVPSLEIKNVVNNSAKTINLKAYKGKTLIIHFLVTTCPSCVASSKKYGSLLKAYGNKLKVLIVTPESRERVQKFIAKYPSYFGQIPVVVNDSILRKLFPYEYVSHIVWINPAGKVAAITGNQYVTPGNIELVSKGVMPQWPVKRDITSFNRQIGLLKINDDNVPYTSMPSSLFYSVLFSNLPGLQVSIYQKTDTVSNTQRITYINHTIPELYMRIFDLQAFPASHILINAPDPGYYFYNREKYYKAAWDTYNTYSYECILPAGYSKEERMNKMVNDLDFNLGLHGYVKDTIVNTLHLIKQGHTSLPFMDSLPMGGKWMAVRNITVHLNEKYLGTPVIDDASEVNEKYVAVDLELLKDIPALKKKLALYGLALINEPSKIHALVIDQEYTFRFNHSPKLYSK